MKKAMIVMLSLATLGLAQQALAAGRGHGDPPRQRLTEALQLEPSQVGEVEQILQEQHEKHRALWEAQREQMRPQMQAIREETIERLRSVLSAEQLQKFIELGRARRAERLPGEPGEPRRPRQ
jgi:hypothetical protein